MKKRAGIVVWTVLAGMALCGVSGAEISYRFERMWPTLRQPWYFNSPYAVACDPLGAVYVADARNHRVQKFSSRGEFITAWGTEGTGAGQFDEPAGLAVDSNGHVLVADRGNSRVLRFTASGVFIAEWGGGVLAHPEGIAVDAFGTIYVADTLNHRIAVFDSNGTLVDSWGARGSGNRQFDRPDGIALDASGRIYVAEYGNHRVQVLAKDGSFMAVWGTEGSGNGQFLTPTDVAVDAQGYVYVTDEGQCRVQKFDTSGAFVTAWGRQGYGRGEFDIPDGIAVAPNGQIFMTDRGRHDYVHVFSPDGAHMATWGSQLTGPNEYNGPVALAKDTTGNIYVADIGNARIQRLDADGRFNAIWGPAPDEPGARPNRSTSPLPRRAMCMWPTGRISASGATAWTGHSRLSSAVRGAGKANSWQACIFAWIPPATSTPRMNSTIASRNLPRTATISGVSVWKVPVPASSGIPVALLLRADISMSRTAATIESKNSPPTAYSWPSGEVKETAPASYRIRGRSKWDQEARCSWPTRATTGFSGSRRTEPSWRNGADSAIARVCCPVHGMCLPWITIGSSSRII